MTFGGRKRDERRLITVCKVRQGREAEEEGEQCSLNEVTLKKLGSWFKEVTPDSQRFEEGAYQWITK